MTIGEQIRAARKAKRITQEELSRRLNLSHTMISRYESGRISPSADILLKTAEILDTEFVIGKNNNSMPVPVLKNLSDHQQIELPDSSTINPYSLWKDGKSFGIVHLFEKDAEMLNRLALGAYFEQEQEEKE